MLECHCTRQSGPSSAQPVTFALLVLCLVILLENLMEERAFFFAAGCWSRARTPWWPRVLERCS